jgi:hypothetical protein
MKRTVLVFGTISGLIAATLMGVSMALMANGSFGDHGAGSMLVGYASMVVAFTFVFVGIKNYRDKQNNGVVTFGKGFLLGLLISFIGSTFYVVTWGIEYHYFFPNFMDGYANASIKNMQASGMSAAQIETETKNMTEMMNSYKNSIVYFTLITYMEIFPVGILVSLISAAVLKRKVAVTA